jgi:hypothetical protein
LKAVHHTSVSNVQFQAVSTWVSSVQPAPPNLGRREKVLQNRLGALTQRRGVAAQVEFESKV